MKLSRTIITLIAAGGLFALTPGLLAQTASTNAGAATGARGQGRGMPTVDEQMTRIDDAVKLTAEQKPKVKAVLEDTQKKMTDLRGQTTLSREDRTAKMQALRDDQTKQIKAILTADQFTKYEAMPRGGRGQGKAGEPKGEAKGTTKAPEKK